MHFSLERSRSAADPLPPLRHHRAVREGATRASSLHRSAPRNTVQAVSPRGASHEPPLPLRESSNGTTLEPHPTQQDAPKTSSMQRDTPEQPLLQEVPTRQPQNLIQPTGHPRPPSTDETPPEATSPSEFTETTSEPRPANRTPPRTSSSGNTQSNLLQGCPKRQPQNLVQPTGHPRPL